MDSDLDLSASARPAESRPATVLALISAGGVLGALARWGIGLAWPHTPGSFPWATWTINVTGCFLIGVLMTSLGRWWPRQRYLRPFFGVGILGGYTTFSTAIVDLQIARPAVALLYLVATVTGAMLAVWLGSLVVPR
jgi:fluoride exporter